MRICHVVPGAYPGYAAPYEYTRALAQEGHQVDVICLQRQSQPLAEYIEGIRVNRVAPKHFSQLTWRDRHSLSTFTLTHIAKKSFDLVHVYAYRGCALLPLFGKRHVKKWVFDLRTGSVSENLWMSAIANKLSASESRLFSARIALDQNVGNHVFGRKLLFHVVPLGVDLSRFQVRTSKSEIRKRLNIPATASVIIYTGSLVAKRRPEKLLEAFAEVAKKFTGAMLMVIGDDGALPQLRQQAQHLDIAEKVLFLGRVPFQEIQDYIVAADIGLAYVPNTPQYQYQPPLKTVEFMACELPTVATNTAGNLVFIKDGYNGLLSPDTSHDIGKCILEFLVKPELYQSVRQNARRSIFQYDWKIIVKEQLLPLYEQLLAGEMNN